MAYGGHALDMIMRLKANRDMKKARRDKIQKGRDSHINSIHVPYPEPKKPEISAETTEKVKLEFQQKIKNESRKRYFTTFLLLLILLAILTLIATVLY